VVPAVPHALFTRERDVEGYMYIYIERERWTKRWREERDGERHVERDGERWRERERVGREIYGGREHQPSANRT
jgi:hypothetical protein